MGWRAGRMLELSSTDSRVGWPEKTPGMQWCPLAWAALPRSVHRPSWPELRVILGGGGSVIVLSLHAGAHGRVAAPLPQARALPPPLKRYSPPGPLLLC